MRLAKSRSTQTTFKSGLISHQASLSTHKDFPQGLRGEEEDWASKTFAAGYFSVPGLVPSGVQTPLHEAALLVSIPDRSRAV